MKRSALNMRLVMVVLGLAALAATAGVGLYGCQSGDQASDQASDQVSKEGELGSAAEMPKDEEILYTCPMHPEVVSSEQGKCPTCGMNLVPVDQVEAGNTAAVASEAGVTYTCPMHPEVVSNEPGECPTCGMDLVPAEKTNDAGTSGEEMKGD